MAINTSAWTHMTGIQDLITRPNLITPLWGYSIYAILYILFFVVFVKSGRGDELEGFVASSVVMFPVTILMAIITLIPAETVLFPIAFAGIGIVVLTVSKGS